MFVIIGSHLYPLSWVLAGLLVAAAIAIMGGIAIKKSR
jgi:hypothetical protein